jgi:citronellyl-CoA synthetase
LETSQPKDLDLIDEKEFAQRFLEVNKKHGGKIEEYIKILTENKTSWGSLVELNAEKYSNKVALKFEDQTFTFREFNEWVNRFANYFISLGVKKRDVIKVFMINHPDYLFIFSAIGKIGAIGSLINSDLRESSLEHCLNLTTGNIVITDEACYNALSSIKSNLKFKKEPIFLYSPELGSKEAPDGFINLREKLKGFSTKNPSSTSSIKSTDYLSYVFTSGTTGLPKASIFSHARMVGSYYLIGPIVAELNSDDTVYIPLPFFHTTALGLGWGPAYGAGAAVALRRKLSISQFWKEIKKFDATAFVYVGEVCRYLLNQPSNPDDSTNTVKTIIGNGLRPDIWLEFKKRFNITRVAEFYGASEIGRVFANTYNFDCTVGFCAEPYAIVKYDYEEDKPIRDEKGFMEKVKVGETGLLLWELNAEGIFIGYTDEKSTEAKIFRNVFEEGDRWFNSGDLLRDQGFQHVQFIDRIGDTFRWKAHNISTTEVEEVLNVFNQVQMSTAYGVKIPGTDGRAGMATVVLTSKIDKFDFTELTNHFKKNLPPYAVPIFLRFKPDLVITSTFKFSKVKLKREGFDLRLIEDPIYILLPINSEYTLLTEEIYQNLQDKKYRF